MRITNLDSLVAEDQKIILKGKEYFIPGEISVNVVLRLIKLQDEIQNDPMNFELWDEQCYIVYDIIKEKHPELEYDVFKKSLTAKQTGALMGLFMNSLGEFSEGEVKQAIEESQQENIEAVK